MTFVLLTLQRRPPIDARKGKQNIVSVLQALIHLAKELEDLSLEFLPNYFIFSCKPNFTDLNLNFIIMGL